MSVLRVYADTSVFGGRFDPEFAGPSNEFFDAVRDGRIRLVLSDTTLAELQGAPQRVQEMVTGLPTEILERVSVTPEVMALRDA